MVSSPGCLTAIPSAIVPPSRPARLDTDEPNAGPERAQRDRDACGEPAAADRQEERLCVRQLLGELEPDRSLAGDHGRILERVHERGACLVGTLACASASASSKPAPASTVSAP